jgi:hypothetical protein
MFWRWARPCEIFHRKVRRSEGLIARRATAHPTRWRQREPPSLAFCPSDLPVKISLSPMTETTEYRRAWWCRQPRWSSSKSLWYKFARPARRYPRPCTASRRAQCTDSSSCRCSACRCIRCRCSKWRRKSGRTPVCLTSNRPRPRRLYLRSARGPGSPSRDWVRWHCRQVAQRCIERGRA